MRTSCRLLIGLSLIGLTIISAGCRSAGSVRRVDHDREIAGLRQQVDKRDRLIANLEAELQLSQQNRERFSADDSATRSAQELVLRHMLGGGRNPSLAGRVTDVSGQMCTVTVDANPADVDIQKAIDDRTIPLSTYDDSGGTTRRVCLLRFAIYGGGRHKADVQAIRFDASVGGVLCEIMPSDEATKIVVGDKADSRP